MLISWLFSRDEATAGAPLNGSQVDPQSFLKLEQDDYDGVCFTLIIKAVYSDLGFSLSRTWDRSLFFTFWLHTWVIDSACSLTYSTKYQQLINCLREKSSPWDIYMYNWTLFYSQEKKFCFHELICAFLCFLCFQLMISDAQAMIQRTLNYGLSPVSLYGTRSNLKQRWVLCLTLKWCFAFLTVLLASLFLGIVLTCLKMYGS